MSGLAIIGFCLHLLSSENRAIVSQTAFVEGRYLVAKFNVLVPNITNNFFPGQTSNINMFKHWKKPFLKPILLLFFVFPISVSLYSVFDLSSDTIFGRIPFETWLLFNLFAGS